MEVHVDIGKKGTLELLMYRFGVSDLFKNPGPTGFQTIVLSTELFAGVIWTHQNSNVLLMHMKRFRDLLRIWQ